MDRRPTASGLPGGTSRTPNGLNAVETRTREDWTPPLEARRQIAPQMASAPAATSEAYLKYAENVSQDASRQLRCKLAPQQAFQTVRRSRPSSRRPRGGGR